MFRTDLLRSTGFRLVAWYALVFGVSVSILLGVMYWIAVTAVEIQLDDSVARETRLLIDIYNTRGRDALGRGIMRRTGELTSPRRYYLLQDQQGRVVAGNLPSMTPTEGRLVMSVPRTGKGAGPESSAGPERMVAQGRSLDGGYFLLVGENQYRLVKMKEAMFGAIGWGTAFTIVLALGGGLLLAIGYLRRIEEVNRTIRAIINGSLAQRVPTSGSDEMGRLAANLNSMLDRIGSLMESLKSVSDDIAHDLRTPLSRLRQRLETAVSRPLTPREHVSVLERSIVDLDAILDTFAALLRIAQVESGSRRSAFAKVDLSQLVASLAETYVPVAQDRGHRLEYKSQPGATILGDRELLVQMLVNLIENAIQHSGVDGTITVQLLLEKGELLLRVTDTGPGIGAEERAKVFRRFYRLERSRTSAGNGLGLALVKAVVDLHNARIELTDNRPGLCVSVHFEVPFDVGQTAITADALAAAVR